MLTSLSIIVMKAEVSPINFKVVTLILSSSPVSAIWTSITRWRVKGRWNWTIYMSGDGLTLGCLYLLCLFLMMAWTFISNRSIWQGIWRYRYSMYHCFMFRCTYMILTNYYDLYPRDKGISIYLLLPTSIYLFITNIACIQSFGTRYNMYTLST